MSGKEALIELGRRIERVLNRFHEEGIEFGEATLEKGQIYTAFGVEHFQSKITVPITGVLGVPGTVNADLSVDSRCRLGMPIEYEARIYRRPSDATYYLVEEIKTSTGRRYSVEVEIVTLSNFNNLIRTIMGSALFTSKNQMQCYVAYRVVREFLNRGNDYQVSVEMDTDPEKVSYIVNLRTRDHIEVSALLDFGLIVQHTVYGTVSGQGLLCNIELNRHLSSLLEFNVALPSQGALVPPRLRDSNGIFFAEGVVGSCLDGAKWSVSIANTMETKLEELRRELRRRRHNPL